MRCYHALPSELEEITIFHHVEQSHRAPHICRRCCPFTRQCRPSTGSRRQPRSDSGQCYHPRKQTLRDHKTENIVLVGLICVQQPNSVDCGVYALVNARHLLFLDIGQMLPVTINASIWRAVFASQYLPHSVVLPQTT